MVKVQHSDVDYERVHLEMFKQTPSIWWYREGLLRSNIGAQNLSWEEIPMIELQKIQVGLFNNMQSLPFRNENTKVLRLLTRHMP